MQRTDPMGITFGRTRRRARRRPLLVALVVAATVTAAVGGVATPTATAQAAASAEIRTSCDQFGRGVITIELVGSDEEEYLAMIGGSVLGPVSPGTNVFEYPYDGTHEVLVGRTGDGGAALEQI